MHADATPELAGLLVENERLRALATSRRTGDEEQISRLAGLYVAINSLHSALDEAGVLASVRDIVTTLIGSEETAVFELDRDRDELRVLDSIGVVPDACRPVRLGEGPVGIAASSAKAVIRHEGGARDGRGDERLTACVPLVLDGQVTGVLAIYGLLPQKSRLDSSDLDLLDALAVHVPVALAFARLYSASRAARACR